MTGAYHFQHRSLMYYITFKQYTWIGIKNSNSISPTYWYMEMDNVCKKMDVNGLQAPHIRSHNSRNGNCRPIPAISLPSNSVMSPQYSTSSKCSLLTSNGIFMQPSISARGMFLTSISTSPSGDKPVPVNLALQDTECSRKALACQIVSFSLPWSPACSLLPLAALSAISSKRALDMNFSWASFSTSGKSLTYWIIPSGSISW